MPSEDEDYQKLKLPEEQNFENKGGIYYSCGKHISSNKGEVKKDLTKSDVIKKYINRFKLR
jgi:hypothetical protein